MIELSPENLNRVIETLCHHLLKCDILHFELERNKELQFGAYDNFTSVSFGSDLNVSFLEQLVEKSVIENFKI